jgi:hypothetical protein
MQSKRKRCQSVCERNDRKTLWLTSIVCLFVGVITVIVFLNSGGNSNTHTGFWMNTVEVSLAPPTSSSPTALPTFSTSPTALPTFSTSPTALPTISTSPTTLPTVGATCSLPPFNERFDTALTHLKRFPYDTRVAIPFRRIFVANGPPVTDVVYLAEEPYGLTCNRLVTLVGFLHRVSRVRIPEMRNIAFSRGISQMLLKLDLGYVARDMNSILINCDQHGAEWTNEHYVHGSRELICDAYSPTDDDNNIGQMMRRFTPGIHAYVDEEIKQEAMFRYGGQISAWNWPFILPSLTLRQEVEAKIADIVYHDATPASRKQVLFISVHHRNFRGDCLSFVAESAKCASNPGIICDYRLSEEQANKIFQEMPRLKTLTEASDSSALFFSSDGQVNNHLINNELDPRLKINNVFTCIGPCFEKNRVGEDLDFMAIMWTFSLSDVHFENPVSTCGPFVLLWRKMFGMKGKIEKTIKKTMYPPQCYWTDERFGIGDE